MSTVVHANHRLRDANITIFTLAAYQPDSLSGILDT